MKGIIDALSQIHFFNPYIVSSLQPKIVTLDISKYEFSGCKDI